MAALRMQVTRDRRASGCRSADAAVPSSSGKGTGETASHIPAQSRLHTLACWQPAPGRRGQGREGASPAMSAGGNRHPNRGCVPQPLLARSPAPRWICCFCSPSIFPISLSLLTHTLWVSPSYLKHSAGAGGIGMGTSTHTHHHYPTKK